jgi:hypothetical protein
MKKLFGVLAISFALISLAFPVLAADPQTWTGVSLMDGHCSEKMASDPDSHPRSCAIQCAKGGYGLITADGKFLKFDEAGNKQALEALKKSEANDHLRATVKGTLDGDVITVTSISID